MILMIIWRLLTDGCSYLYMHDMIRNTTGIGEGKGPYIAIHDGFQGLSAWSGKRNSFLTPFYVTFSN
jgi:hypothetical protein